MIVSDFVNIFSIYMSHVKLMITELKKCLKLDVFFLKGL